ncbi:hypothetical protein [Rubritalea tangerina]|uniref:hypothetical protein n=1 Tax=Rubritalea tangerina TaxID=430798 RepID=UPI00360B7CB6
MHNVIVVIQLSRACGAPSLRLDILQAHSDHSSIPYRSMVLVMDCGCAGWGCLYGYAATLYDLRVKNDPKSSGDDLGSMEGKWGATNLQITLVKWSIIGV